MDDIFKIFKLDIQESEKIELQENIPHQHNFEELIIGKKGQLEHFIDFNAKLMDAPFISFITQGKIHRVRPLPKDGECDIWVLRFKSEFIADTTFQLYSSFHENANICLKDDICFERLSALCQIIYDEYRQLTPDYAIIRDLLSALFTIIESERNKLKLNNEENRKIRS